MSKRSFQLLQVFMAFSALLVCRPVLGQVDPEGAHVNLYFPQLADGGTSVQKWRTSFMFVNPHPENTAVVTLRLYGDDGNPLALDFGQGATSTLTFSVAPQGRVDLRSTVASSNILTGWALAQATTPLQATVIYRAISNNAALIDLSAPATLPTILYRSPASRNLGIALANVYSVPITANIQALDQNGKLLGTAPVSIPARGHTSFNLAGVLPSLPSNYIGSIAIATTSYANPYFLAWTLNEDSGMLSTLPPGSLEWPISHLDRIALVFQKAVQAAKSVFKGVVNLDAPPVMIEICDGDPRDGGINAFADPAINTVHVTFSLSELVSDSESELGFLVCHALGHMIQARTNQLMFSNDTETDADQMAILLSLAAGFDPYAGAGALAKVSMASNVLSSYWDAFGNSNYRRAFADRIANMHTLLVAICSSASNSAYCTQYKTLIHPSFPVAAPLSVPIGRTPTPIAK